MRAETAHSGEGAKGKETRSTRIVTIAITTIAIAMVTYHLVYTQYMMQGVIRHQNAHFAFALVLVFLTGLQKRRKLWPLSLALIIASLVATGYVQVFEEDLQLRQGWPTTPDIVIGFLLAVVAIEATRQTFGIIFPALALLSLGYAFFGHYLPLPLYHSLSTAADIASNISIGLRGMYGTFLSVSANYVFLFVVFGSLLQMSKASVFFMEFGKIAAAKLRGGPA